MVNDRLRVLASEAGVTETAYLEMLILQAGKPAGALKPEEVQEVKKKVEALTKEKVQTQPVKAGVVHGILPPLRKVNAGENEEE